YKRLKSEEYLIEKLNLLAAFPFSINTTIRECLFFEKIRINKRHVVFLSTCLPSTTSYHFSKRI
ncbi:TPA: hypothetical protein ACG4WI_002227, partial [Enterococcus faecium]